MFRLTFSAAALALALAAGGQAMAADRMSEKDYERAIEKCKKADSTALRDDCLADVQDQYQQQKLDPGSTDDDRDLTRQVEDKLLDQSPRDDVGGGGGRGIRTNVPDRLN